MEIVASPTVNNQNTNSTKIEAKLKIMLFARLSTLV